MNFTLPAGSMVLGQALAYRPLDRLAIEGDQVRWTTVRLSSGVGFDYGPPEVVAPRDLEEALRATVERRDRPEPPSPPTPRRMLIDALLNVLFHPIFLPFLFPLLIILLGVFRGVRQLRRHGRVGIYHHDAYWSSGGGGFGGSHYRGR